MSWSHIDTDMIRNPAGSDRTRLTSPTSCTWFVRVPKPSSFLFAVSGCGLPSGLNQPTPPPRMRTQSGRVALGSEPTFEPITKVW